MRTQSLVIFTILLIISVFHGSVLSAAPPSSAIADQCSSEFSKVGVCLAFASGKADTPTKECCSTISEIREKHAVCLCFVIQQAHNGGAQLKSLGIQEAKLLQLPTACKLANASIANCPGLLNLAPGSPDYAIFNSTTTAPATTTPTGATPTTPSTPSKNDTAVGFKHAPLLTGPIAVIVTIVMFFAVFSM
ncbi:hypothetical protein ACHQM5_008044 [Ranunculus cassubicifolius]